LVVMTKVPIARGAWFRGPRISDAGQEFADSFYIVTEFDSGAVPASAYCRLAYDCHNRSAGASSRSQRQVVAV
jgi:hypothetical protein